MHLDKSWDIELKCATPSFQATINGKLLAREVEYFINNLRDIETNRKGQCQLVDEWSFSLTIRSVDSLGHFVADTSIWSQGVRHDNELTDTMRICFDIEPSLLTNIISEFKMLRE
jgi:hypothetical protein